MRKKIFVKFTAVLLACLSVLPLAFGCKKGKTLETPPNSSGVHENNDERVPGKFFMQDGRCDYEIVIPHEFAGLATSAAADIKFYFQEATSCELSVVTDKDKTYTAASKYISVGETSLLKQAGLSVPGELKRDGFKITTVGDSIFIIGKTQSGTQFGALEFLYKIIGLDYYYTGFYALDRGVDEIPFTNYKTTSSPDFDERFPYEPYIQSDATLKKFYRYNGQDMILVNGYNTHNDISYFTGPGEGNDLSKVPNAKWKAVGASHSLCYNAQGDASAREAMMNKAVASAQTALKNNMTSNYLPFCHQDYNEWCGCAACTAKKANYGENSGIAIEFANELSRRIRAWFETEDGKPFKRDLRVLIFAYEATIAPPDPKKIKCEPGVAVRYAPLTMDYTRPLTVPEGQPNPNQRYKADIDEWATVAPEFALWLYGTNFQAQMVPYDTFNSMQNIYQYFAGINTTYFFEQTHNGSQTTWQVLRSWLSSKLRWNVNADVSALIDRFFKDFYGPAEDEMRQWFDNQRLYINTLRDLKPIGYGGDFSIYQISHIYENFWPMKVLTGWTDYAQNAVAAIEPLKDGQPKIYAAYNDHIALERLCPLYLLTRLHKDSVSAATLTEWRRTFKTDCNRLGVTREKESGALSDYWQSWLV